MRISAPAFQLPRFGMDDRPIRGFVEDPDKVELRSDGYTLDFSAIPEAKLQLVLAHNLRVVAADLQKKLDEAGLQDVLVRSHPDTNNFGANFIFKHGGLHPIPKDAREPGLYLTLKRPGSPEMPYLHLQPVLPVPEDRRERLLPRLASLPGMALSDEPGTLTYRFRADTREHAFKVKFAPANHPWFPEPVPPNPVVVWLEKAFRRLFQR